MLIAHQGKFGLVLDVFDVKATAGVSAARKTTNDLGG